ncbi:hypothetical protein BDZ91DRAFT_208543 [Kalaharituber pfeilii]|nr:hypothetical protein BDZ91DRAFT_208543 [Kalaharituber pfeilii]
MSGNNYEDHSYPISPQPYKPSSANLSHPRYHGHSTLPQSYSFPSKQPHHPRISHPLSPVASAPHHVDPDGVDDDVELHSPTASVHAPSFSNSVSSSSYAGSAADEASDENEIDLITLLTEKLSSAFDPIPLDRSLAIQAQTSGMLNSKTRELIALQEEAAARLAQTKRSFMEGMRIAKEVKADLECVHKRVINLQMMTQQKYPVEYAKARERIPPPST